MRTVNAWVLGVSGESGQRDSQRPAGAPAGPAPGAKRRGTGAQRRVDRFERSEKAGKGTRCAPPGAPAGPAPERSDGAPARSAGLTASSEARKRAKGLEPSTFSLGITIPRPNRLKNRVAAFSTRVHGRRGVPFVPVVSPYFRTVPYMAQGGRGFGLRVRRSSLSKRGRVLREAFPT